MLFKCFSKALLGFSSSPKRVSLLQSQMLALLSAMLGYNCFLQQLGSIIITTTIIYNHNSDRVNSYKMINIVFFLMLIVNIVWLVLIQNQSLLVKERVRPVKMILKTNTTIFFQFILVPNRRNECVARKRFL